MCCVRSAGSKGTISENDVETRCGSMLFAQTPCLMATLMLRPSIRFGLLSYESQLINVNMRHGGRGADVSAVFVSPIESPLSDGDLVRVGWSMTQAVEAQRRRCRG